MPMTLTILGSGTNVHPTRAAAGYLVRTDELLLFDFGPRTLKNLMKAGVNRHRIRHILFSHFHADHFSDFVPFFFDAVYHSKFVGKRPDLTIIGPRGTRATAASVAAIHDGAGESFAAEFVLEPDAERVRFVVDGEVLDEFELRTKPPQVDALLLAGERSDLHGDAYNLGHDSTYSLLEFLERLRQHCEFEYACVPFPPDAERIDIGDYYADYSSATALTGWEPATPLPDALDRTLRFYREHLREYV